MVLKNVLKYYALTESRLFLEIHRNLIKISSIFWPESKIRPFIDVLSKTAELITFDETSNSLDFLYNRLSLQNQLNSAEFFVHVLAKNPEFILNI